MSSSIDTLKAQSCREICGYPVAISKVLESYIEELGFVGALTPNHTTCEDARPCIIVLAKLNNVQILNPNQGFFPENSGRRAAAIR